jgi:DNA-binding beta-propeller fold protein YncE
VSLGGSPEPVAVVRRGSAVVVGNTDRFAADQSQARTVSVVDARDALSAEPAVIGSVAVGSFPRAIDKSPDERTLFISNYNSNSLDVIDVDALPVR